MKKLTTRLITAIVIICILTTGVFASEYLIPVGKVVGLDLASGTVTIAAFDDATPSAKTAGIQAGDQILSIDGAKISCAEDVRQALNHSKGTVELVVDREGAEKAIRITPQITAQGPRLGVFLRQGITGIGTVTWYNPNTGAFGTLGHGVNDSKGCLLKMTEGKVYPAKVASVQKGKAGAPGQLKGALSSDTLLGSVTVNTQQGVFGTARNAWTGDAIPTAAWEEIRTGNATIRSTVTEGEPQDYSVEILKIYSKTRADGRNFLIRVTDPKLLEATGGIVQGMGVSYNRDNTGTLISLQGLGDSPGFSLTKKNPCACAGTQGEHHSSAMIKRYE